MHMLEKFMRYLFGIVSLLWLISAEAVFAEPISVGVVLGFSGPASFWAAEQRLGIELALDELKKSGNELRIVWEDSKTTPTGAVTAFKKLVDADKVKVVVGDVFAFVTEPLIPIAEQHSVPLVTPAFPRAACERGKGWVFTLASQIPDSIEAYEDLLSSLDIKSVAIITFDDAGSWGGAYRDVWLKAAAKLKIEVKEDLALAEITPDFRAIFPKIVRKRPDAILFAHEPLSARNALRTTGFSGKFISTNAVLEVLANRTADKSLVEGVYLVDPVMSPRFVEAFKLKFHKTPVLESHASYEAMHVIAEASRNSGLPLREALRQVKRPGVAGNIDLSDPCRGRSGQWLPWVIKDGRLQALSRPPKTQ